MVTGSNAVDPETDSTNSPRSNARRHLKTWFAFTPLACATCATLAPGSNVSSTIRRFSDKARRLRGRRSATNPSERIMTHRRLNLDYMPEGITTRLRLFACSLSSVKISPQYSGETEPRGFSWQANDDPTISQEYAEYFSDSFQPMGSPLDSGFQRYNA